MKNFSTVNVQINGGMDILEFLSVLRCNKILSDLNTCRDHYMDGSPNMFKKYREFKCAECQTKCDRHFEGTLVVNVGLNNLLKSDVRQFRHQSFSGLAKNLKKCLRDNFPKCTPHIMLPILPVKYQSDDDFKEQHKELTEALLTGTDNPLEMRDYPLPQGRFDNDGIHLTTQASIDFFSSAISIIQ
ncbi:Oidioi.mRNA.OKI2018_I69.chr2.g4189.t1.cds [Oikopleura dioica]|uniref:Oidioi.mRNA.OKI2018_I69.chr2.g4189.t1.cds n=1 Tax=Oikopleura dioica TaxID=34765 RepID=A0ABN7T203_OIKDI|nr:Oidioi.mRNA.OKI2018_I69.chr2.g4189.t1.cds [Oikopleura dioica]